MKGERLLIAVSLVVFVCLVAGAALAQSAAVTPAAATATSAVPNLINYSGVLKDASGRMLTGVTGVTFLLYRDEQGGAPLWMETQNVTPDRTGHYTVELGATSASGMPPGLFVNGEARWLALQVGSEAEQARTMLVAVPYAMKAGDAETIGGLPPSAFVLAVPVNAAAPDASAPSAAAVTSSATSDVTTTGGTANTIPLFTTATNVQNSILTQTTTTAINVGGKLNLPATGTATSTAGKNSQPHDFIASAYNSGTAAAVAQTFQLQAEPAGNDTATPSGTLNLLYASGTATPAETGLKISSKGLISFASGQTFPGVPLLTTADTFKAPLAVDEASGDTAITGDQTATTGLTTGVEGTASSTTTGASGVYGYQSATTGEVYGVYGYTASTTGGATAVYGDEGAATGAVVGVYGYTASTTSDATAVWGNENAASGVVYGVYGQTVSTSDYSAGTYGYEGATTGAVYGVTGYTASTTGYAAGVRGNEAATTGAVYGVWGTTSSTTQSAAGVGAYEGAATGPVDGVLAGIASTSSGSFGVFGYDNATTGSGVGIGGEVGSPDGAGGYFINTSTSGGYIVEGESSTGVVFSVNTAGDADFKGTVSCSGCADAIDDPADPANKYLYHSAVESPDMMNVYNGNITTNEKGVATVVLPDYFEALNRDFRYQLTVIGQFAQAIIAEEINHNQFTIKTSLPNVKVSWQVTGIRQDAWANAHRIPNEVEKPAEKRGYYLHPELYGASPDKSINAKLLADAKTLIPSHPQPQPAPQARKAPVPPPPPAMRRPVAPQVRPTSPAPSATALR